MEDKDGIDHYIMTKCTGELGEPGASKTTALGAKSAQELE